MWPQRSHHHSWFLLIRRRYDVLSASRDMRFKNFFIFFLPSPIFFKKGIPRRQPWASTSPLNSYGQNILILAASSAIVSILFIWVTLKFWFSQRTVDSTMMICVVLRSKRLYCVYCYGYYLRELVVTVIMVRQNI